MQCKFEGKMNISFQGNTLRQLCVSEETAVHGEDACRFENVKDIPNYAIVRAADGYNFFCQKDEILTVGDATPPVSDIGEDGKLTDDAKKKF